MKLVSYHYLAMFLWALLSHGEGLATEPLNLTTAKEKVIEYYKSGDYSKDANRAVDYALWHFSCHERDPQKKEIIIFDIDDTALSAYDHIQSINFGYIPKIWDGWMLQADLPAIKPVKRLYDQLITCGYRIVFISGRSHTQYDVTVKNLHEQGYTKFDKLILRSPEEKKLSAQAFKFGARQRLRAEGYTIIGSIGDQYSDICCEDMGFTVKIPNPMYILY
jgi:acid phosphatase